MSNCTGSNQFLDKFGISPTNRTIASDAVNICFCNDENKLNCSLTEKKISAYKGQLISFKLTTLTRCRKFTPSVINICEDSTLTPYDMEKCYPNIHYNCKRVSFNVYSKQVSRGTL